MLSDVRKNSELLFDLFYAIFYVFLLLHFCKVCFFVDRDVGNFFEGRDGW
jgi:hypothetical protein